MSAPSSNTRIQIRRSSTNPTPGASLNGELGYSYVSNTLFIGTPDSASYLEIAAWSDLTNLTPGIYGGQTQIPTFTVDNHGKIVNVANVAISTNLSFSDGINTGSVNLLTDALEFVGNSGITTNASGNTITISTDNTIVRANTSGAYQTIDGVLNISGDLHVSGNLSYTEEATIISQNSLIFLANNNTISDVIDIGFVGQYNNGTVIAYTGLFRHAGDAGKDYYLFDNYAVNPDGSFVIDPYTNGFEVSTLHANLISGSVQSHKFLADESSDTNGGYGFSQDGSQDTGMYSAGDGQLQFKSNSNNNFEIGDGTFTHHTDVTLPNGATLGDTSGNAVFFGYDAGQTSQGYSAVAVGSQAGQTSQSGFAIAVGLNAGNNTQGTSSVAIGHASGENSQGQDAVAVGVVAGKTSQGSSAVAIGTRAAYNTQGSYAVAIGSFAAYNDQGNGAVAIGDSAGYNYQSTDGIAIGTYAALNNNNGNGWATIAIGRYAGEENSGSQSVAIGSFAGNNGLGYHSVAIGHYAASNGSGERTVAIGDYAGESNASLGSIAIGYASGAAASNYSVAIGYGAGSAGTTALGQYQIAIGAYAGAVYGYDNSIVLNATGVDFDSTASGFFVNPVRYEDSQEADDGIVFYNQSTKEFRYSYALDGGSF